MRYSTPRQIRAGNVARRKPAWRSAKPGLEAIPIVVDGAMSAAAPDGVDALAAETGELLWKCAAALAVLRELADWKKTVACIRRQRLILPALDRAAGKPAPEAGHRGRVDLKKDRLGDAGRPVRAAIATPDLRRWGRHRIGQRGRLAGGRRLRRRARGDAETGKLLWTFHLVSRPGERAAATWMERNGWSKEAGRFWTAGSATRRLLPPRKPSRQQAAEHPGGQPYLAPAAGRRLEAGGEDASWSTFTPRAAARFAQVPPRRETCRKGSPPTQRPRIFSGAPCGRERGAPATEWIRKRARRRRAGIEST